MDFKIIKENDLFYLSNPVGASEQIATEVFKSGLFTRDTRVLSRLEWFTNPYPVMMQESEHREGFECIYRYTNCLPREEPDLNMESLCFTRRQFVDGYALYEHGSAWNHGNEDITCDLGYIVDADFVDIFEVRGIAPPVERQIRVSTNGMCCRYHYTAQDGRKYSTTVSLVTCSEGQVDDEHDTQASWVPVVGTARKFEWTICIPAGQNVTWDLKVIPEIHVQNDSVSSHYVTENVSNRVWNHTCQFVQASYDEWFENLPTVHGDERFQRWYQQGIQDIRMLLTDFGYGRVLTAGVPWYAVPFGRDSLIAARQMMLAAPDIAEGTLRTLAQFQGKKVNAVRDEQPGKIVHELRDGELSRAGILPFARYYGSVDATPLFLNLLADYFKWTGDTVFIKELLFSVKRAFSWIETYGDRDGDGFVEYGSERKGMCNQGWKDSHDSVMHKDGRLAKGPIALCEVQGYVYRAYQDWAQIYKSFGEEERAEEYMRKAQELSARFVEQFYLEEEGIVALALDGQKRPLRVASSNMGQVLCSGILPQELSLKISERMLQKDLFTGFGIRTLSALEQSYNPLSYHNGAVWPHDTSMVLQGVSRFGTWEQAERIISGLLRAQESFDHGRLPELFSGFNANKIEQVERPTPHPGACSPQAWAAAVPIFVLEHILGIDPHVQEGRVRIHANLPNEMNSLDVDRIPLGKGTFSISLCRKGALTEATVTANTTQLCIEVVDGAKASKALSGVFLYNN